MSDLLPLVGEILKDRCIDDLGEENKALKKRLRRTRVVEVTGPNGSPIYASGDLEEGIFGTLRHDDDDDDRWIVNLNRCEECPLEKLMDLEIWLSQQRFLRFDARSGGSYQYSTQVVEMEFKRPKMVYIDAQIHPKPDNFFVSTATFSGERLIPWLSDEMETLGKTIEFERICLRIPEFQRIFDDLSVSQEQQRHNRYQQFYDWIFDSFLQTHGLTDDDDLTVEQNKRINETMAPNLSDLFDSGYPQDKKDNDFEEFIRPFLQLEMMDGLTEVEFNLEFETALESFHRHKTYDYTKERNLMKRWLGG